MRALVLSLAALSLTGCLHRYETSDRRDPDRPKPVIVPASQVGRAQAGDAARSAAQRCGPLGTFQRAGTDGTAPADYDCERPPK
jgi:hypothetical protein